MSGQWILVVLFWSMGASVTTYPNEASCRAEEKMVQAYYLPQRPFEPVLQLTLCAPQASSNYVPVPALPTPPMPSR